MPATDCAVLVSVHEVLAQSFLRKDDARDGRRCVQDSLLHRLRANCSCQDGDDRCAVIVDCPLIVAQVLYAPRTSAHPWARR